MPGGLEPGDVLEDVGAERDVVRSDDPPALVDPEDRRHVHDVAEVGEHVRGVDQ